MIFQCVLAAVGGSFYLSFMQQFATDVYLDAFLEEMRQLGLTCEISG